MPERRQSKVIQRREALQAATQTIDETRAYKLKEDMLAGLAAARVTQDRRDQFWTILGTPLPKLGLAMIWANVHEEYGTSAQLPPPRED